MTDDRLDETDRPADGTPPLARRLLDGDQRALARAISVIENRGPGYPELVGALYRHAGNAHVVGITGSPGAGKSTLADRLTRAYRARGLTVGMLAVDPSSPFTGGAVLGDRIRMGSTAGDPGVFVRSMSTRGHLGGLSPATDDAVTALDAYGADRVLVETVGAGQSEVEVVRTADTVIVLVPPESGDDVQMLKAGILEIGDVFVVNKADLPGAERVVAELEAMLELGADRTGAAGEGSWRPPVVETVATTGEGLDDLIDALCAHHDHLDSTGRGAAKERERAAAAIRTGLRDEAGALLERALERRGGLAAAVDRVVARESDPYAEAAALVSPLADCLDDRNNG